MAQDALAFRSFPAREEDSGPLSADDVPQNLAAIDLGSNSFHLIVAQEVNGRLQTVDRIREMVRLAGGLGLNQQLTEAAVQRSLDCLERFGQRVRHLQRENVRVVGTNALRQARDAAAFIAKAEQLLGHQVEIISGREEARLIYLGVSHALEDNHERRLVFDIGGGSTEFILGRRFQPEVMESLYIGCVSLSHQCFNSGALTWDAFKSAIDQCKQELQSIRNQYLTAGWDTAIGASGTMLAVQNVLTNLHGEELNNISREGVEDIIARMVQAKHLKKLVLPGLSPNRQKVFPGGVAVLMAIIESLRLERLQVSQGALREGLLWDLLGRVHHQDTRDHSVRDLMRRYQIDVNHAKRVRDTALSLLAQVAPCWRLQASEDRLLLGWAADLHEIGLDIAHNQYHKHGGYLLAHMDMPGFSRLGQGQLATLVRLHRHRFLVEGNALPQEERVLRLAALLRLAVILHRGRDNDPLPHVAAEASNNELLLTLPKEWLAKRSLTKLDLRQEADYLAPSTISLQVKSS